MPVAVLADAAANAAFAFLLLAMLASFVRVVRGPDLADRVLALDLLSLTLVAYAAAYAAQTGKVAFLDVSLALALLSFFTTVVFARYIHRRTPAPDEEVDVREDAP